MNSFHYLLKFPMEEPVIKKNVAQMIEDLVKFRKFWKFFGCTKNGYFSHAFFHKVCYSDSIFDWLKFIKNWYKVPQMLENVKYYDELQLPYRVKLDPKLKSILLQHEREARLWAQQSQALDPKLLIMEMDG